MLDISHTASSQEFRHHLFGLVGMTGTMVPVDHKDEEEDPVVAVMIPTVVDVIDHIRVGVMLYLLLTLNTRRVIQDTTISCFLFIYKKET